MFCPPDPTVQPKDNIEKKGVRGLTIIQQGFDFIVHLRKVAAPAKWPSTPKMALYTLQNGPLHPSIGLSIGPSKELQPIDPQKIIHNDDYIYI